MSPSQIVTESTITCPACGTAKTEVMPIDACQYFYECTGCGILLRPKNGDCCVFCSYGSVPCPPIQGSPARDVPCCESEESRAAAEIRRGIQRPDWSVLTKPAAREALLGRDRSRAGPSPKWLEALPALHDEVWRAVIKLFGERGRAPRLDEIANEIGLTQRDAREVLAALEMRDLLRMDDASGAIAYAYPFAAQATGHTVQFDGRALNALCAVDALGAGGMLRADVTITSSCRLCGASVEIETMQRGTAIKRAQPLSTVIWYDLAYSHAAASSCCPAISFFCGDEHLRVWQMAQPDSRAGYRLALDEALEVGRAIFEPVLATPTTSPEQAGPCCRN